MVKPDKETLLLAVRKTRKKPCKYRIAAICYSDNRLLGISYNRPRFSRKGGGVHAEMSALQRWGTEITQMTLVRFGNDDNLLPIHPCVNCRKVLDRLGILVNLG